MPVQSIECQLVRAQIGRYLSGETFTTDIMRQLEVHLLACDECKEALASRKADLLAKAMRNDVAAKAPAQEAEETKPAAEQIAQRAAVSMKAFRAATKAADPAPATRPNFFAKPLILTLALGAVLVAMSRMSGQSGLFPFGPKAAGDFFSSQSAPQHETAPKSTPTAAAPPTSGTASGPRSTSPKPPAPTASASPVIPAAKPVQAPPSKTTPKAVPPATNPATTPPKTTDTAKKAIAPVKTSSAEAAPKAKPTAKVQTPPAHKARRMRHRARHRSAHRSVRKAVHHRSPRIRVYDSTGALITR